MTILKIFLLGFVIKIMTGLDDMITRVPVISAITHTRKGKIAFSIGVVLAVSTATLIAYFFSSLLQNLPAYRYIVVGLIFCLAAAIYFDFFDERSRTKAKAKFTKKAGSISLERFTQLIGIGFFASFLTVLDDVIAYLPIFLEDAWLIPYGVAGILSATLFQAVLVIYFAEKIDKIPYKEEIAALSLIALGTLILFGIL